MNPVMKQYAASGNVECTGSTSVMRWRFESTVRGLAHSCAVSTMVLWDSLEDAGCGRASIFCSAYSGPVGRFGGWFVAVIT